MQTLVSSVVYRRTIDKCAGFVQRPLKYQLISDVHIPIEQDPVQLFRTLVYQICQSHLSVLTDLYNLFLTDRFYWEQYAIDRISTDNCFTFVKHPCVANRTKPYTAIAQVMDRLNYRITVITNNTQLLEKAKDAVDNLKPRYKRNITELLNQLAIRYLAVYVAHMIDTYYRTQCKLQTLLNYLTDSYLFSKRIELSGGRDYLHVHIGKQHYRLSLLGSCNAIERIRYETSDTETNVLKFNESHFAKLWEWNLWKLGSTPYDEELIKQHTYSLLKLKYAYNRTWEVLAKLQSERQDRIV